MILTLTQYDVAAITGCYLNGCTIDEIYSIFEGQYYKTEIIIVIDEFNNRTGWKGKEFKQKVFNNSII